MWSPLQGVSWQPSKRSSGPFTSRKPSYSTRKSSIGSNRLSLGLSDSKAISRRGKETRAAHAVALAPQLSPTALSDFVSSAYAASTHKQIKTAQRFYASIIESSGGQASPVTSDNLILMICCMTRSDYKYSTIPKYVSHVQGWATREVVLQLSAKDRVFVSLALRAAKKLTDGPPKQAFTLSKDEVKKVVLSLDALNPVAADLFLTGTVALLRIGEALALQAGHVETSWFDVGDGQPGNIMGVILTIQKSKTDIGGQGSFRPIPCTSLSPFSVGSSDTVESRNYLCQSPFCAAHRVLRRSRLADSPDAPLFNISREDYSSLLRQAITSALGSTDVSATSHSMRRSGASVCFSMGWSLQLLGEFGRWASSECRDKIYLRNSIHRTQVFAQQLYNTWHHS